MELAIGKMKHGPRNLLSDVPGVRVGHTTIDEGDCHTGVTVVLPPCRNPYKNKLTAASCVFNGFGKTLGLVQVDELGTLETPIALTNTLNVGRVHDALVAYMLDLCAEDGFRLTTVNPVVCECNDSGISDIGRPPGRRAGGSRGDRQRFGRLCRGSRRRGAGDDLLWHEGRHRLLLQTDRTGR